MQIQILMMQFLVLKKAMEHRVKMRKRSNVIIDNNKEKQPNDFPEQNPPNHIYYGALEGEDMGAVRKRLIPLHGPPYRQQQAKED